MFVSKKLSCILAAMCALVLSVGSAWAQNITVTGKVVDKSNEPIVGAYVVIEGTTTGTSTDIDGAFSLSVPAKGTLKFTCMGYKDVTVAVNGQANVNVTMEDDTMMLEETVVTALGIKKEKKSLGYAVEDLSSKELMKNKTANPISSLSGKIAGVNITQSSGAAGSGAQIILRGGTSASEGKDNQPLFVVDGVIFDNSSSVVGNSGFDGSIRSAMTSSNRVMDINPEDIESMSVLKGPAASALYGSRAANGVILITTKKGKEGHVQVDFSTKLTTSWAARLPQTQNEFARGYMEDTYDASGAYTGTVFNNTTPNYNSWGEKTNAKMYDNLGEFFKTGVITDNSLSVAGGTKNSNFYLSGSYYDQTGVVPNTGYTKYSFRFNGEQKLGVFTFTANAAYSQAHTDKTLTSAGLYGASGTGALYAAYTWGRTDNMKHYLNEDGTRYRMFGDLLDPWSEKDNPYWIINKHKLTDDTHRFTGNVAVKADIFDWWNVSYRMGLDEYTQGTANLIAPGSVIKKEWQNGMKSDNTMRFLYMSHNLMSSMNKKFGDFDLGLLLGAQMDDTRTDRMYSMAWNFQVPNFYSYSNATDDNKTFSHSASKKRLIGVFGEFRASWKNAIFLTVTGRNDWTSTLPIQNRSYFYPSVSGSVVFTQFLQDAGVMDDSILSFGKVRASWAQVGKDTGAYETATELWEVANMNGVTAVGNGWTRGNPYLKPEITRSTEIGLEMSFFKNRLHFDYAYYTNNSFNQILSPRGPQSTGYIFCSINAGNVYNKGMELSISGTPIENRNFSWDMSLNLAGNRGTLDGLPTGTDVMYVTDVQYAGMQAASFNGGNFMAIAGTKWTRVTPIEGSSANAAHYNKVVLDQNGFPQYTTTLNEVGNRESTFTGGFNNSITWKGLSFNMLWEFRVGGDVVNGTQYAMDGAGTSARSGQWRNESLTVTGVRQTGSHDETIGDKTVSVPDYTEVSTTWKPGEVYEFNGKKMLGYNIIKSYYTSYYPYESANYITKVNLLRLRSISLSYSLPKKWMDASGFIKNVTFSVAGNNLLLFSNYNGDPETAASGAGVGGSSSVGFEYCGVPSIAGMTFGINLSF